MRMHRSLTFQSKVNVTLPGNKSSEEPKCVQKMDSPSLYREGIHINNFGIHLNFHLDNQHMYSTNMSFSLRLASQTTRNNLTPDTA